jgi:hypothetical protein
MRRRLPPLPAIVLLCLAYAALAASAPSARAGDLPSPSPTTGILFPRTIWSGLVLATNDSHPAAAPAQLRNYSRQLKNIFGYNQLELVGENSQKMDDPYERWLVPSKDFSLSVNIHNQPGQNYPMKIVLFQGRKKLAEFEPHMSPDSPLFIRGPMYAKGQLVIVLHVITPGDIAPAAAAH